MIIYKFLYAVFLKLYVLTASILSLYNAKAKRWVDGRRNIFHELSTQFEKNYSPVIWMHCASLGEFEQGKPIIEELVKKYSTYKILITFFSPSGYEFSKDYPHAHWKFYLPIDSKKNADKFLNIVQPQLILFVKYEFWYYYLTAAKQRNIPTVLVSGIFRASQPFFYWYGLLHKQMLYCFTHLFVQNVESQNLLKSIDVYKNVTVAGDTRYDRVIQLAQQPFEDKLIEQFIGENKVIICGSNWIEDDEILDHYANSNLDIKFIIAPHNIDQESILNCQKLYKKRVLLSQLQKGYLCDEGTNVLIVDAIGLLSKLYRYANVCYVGGGFGADGVHNVLEAAVYGKPVIFGPEYEKFIEASELITANGAISIDDAIEAEVFLNKLLNDEELVKSMGENAKNYTLTKGGASKNMMDYLKPLLN